MTDSSSLPVSGDQDTLVFNGINGATGKYLLPSLTTAEVSRLAQGFSLTQDEADELSQRDYDLKNPHAGVEADARDLAETGWGAVFAQDAPEELFDALQPLLDLRRSQAGERFKLFRGSDGYFPGDSKVSFLDRHQMGPGPADPDKVPYYLLVVGSPDDIPFSFQYQLDVQYAVGRLHFDALEDYANYARSVVLAETGAKTPPRAAFFGVSNADDRATSLSSEYLVKPLAEKLQTQIPAWAGAAKKAGVATAFPGWQVETYLSEQATKARMKGLLSGGAAPGVLFSASHGISFPKGHEKQFAHQGALIMQDWPGQQIWQDALLEDHYFSADDLDPQTNLLGSLAFFFACYGAGTPRQDEFARQIWAEQTEKSEIAPKNFLARLPQRMLSMPRGGALAVVGHVERAWGVSFFWGQAGPQIRVFQDCFERLIKGNYPVGYAMEVFNNRYAELSSDLTTRLNEIRNFFKKPDDRILANLWTANNDARNYIILGDPAVRLNLASDVASTPPRPDLEPLTLVSPKTVIIAAVQSAPAGGGTPLPGSSGLEAQQVDYGLLDSLKQAQNSLSNSLQNFVGRLSDYLGKALDDATSLEVHTYVSDELDHVRYEDGRFSGARLRALTRIAIDGDTLICVPEQDGEVDLALWKIHMDMVQQAQQSRSDLLKTVVSAATGLSGLIK